MMRPVTTIQQKIMRLVLVISGVAVFLTCIAFVGYQFFAFKQKAINQLSILGAIVASNSTAALAFQDHQAATEILSALKAEKNIVAAAVYDTVGNVFARYPENLPAYKIPAHSGLPGYTYVDGYLKGFEPVVQGDSRVGTLYLELDMKILSNVILQYIMIALIIFGSAISIAYFLSMRLQKKVSTPILALSKTAATISETQNYKARAKKFDNDELGLLTDSFNQMLSRIEDQNEEITFFAQSLELKVNERTAELEKANKELIRQTEFVQAIIDSSVDVIAVFDTDLNYLVLNRHGCEIYGVRGEDIIGRNILDVFPDLGKADMFNELKKATTGMAVHNPYYVSKLTDVVLENFFIPLMDSEQRVHSVLVIGHDITAIVRSTEELKKMNTSLENSNRDLEQFAYVASHDLQEPLRKIQVFSSQLQSHVQGAQANTYIEKIISSALRMSALIKGVLQYSRLNHDEAVFETVDLNSIIENILYDFELLIADKEAVINVEPLSPLRGNVLQLNQLFSNLLSNSLKFCKQKPNVKISSAMVRGEEIESFAEAVPQNKYVMISVADNGIGFPQQYAPTIFNFFQRLHKKEDYSGTGIGLALCKKIVVNHSGHIAVKSTPGEGTTFFVYLPL